MPPPWTELQGRALSHRQWSGWRRVPRYPSVRPSPYLDLAPQTAACSLIETGERSNRFLPCSGTSPKLHVRKQSVVHGEGVGGAEYCCSMRFMCLIACPPPVPPFPRSPVQVDIPIHTAVLARRAVCSTHVLTAAEAIVPGGAALAAHRHANGSGGSVRGACSRCLRTTVCHRYSFLLRGCVIYMWSGTNELWSWRGPEAYCRGML